METRMVKKASLSAVANAIRARGGTSEPLAFPTGFVSAVEAIPAGGGNKSVDPSDVNFGDYDGTIVAAYSAADFLSLATMPDNPSHNGLIAQGWNWSLEDAKAYVAKYGKLNIGQMYTTNDGKTRIYIKLNDGRLSPTLGIYPNGTVDIDWGDGTPHDTVSGGDAVAVVNTQHTYSAPGNYVIALTVITGSMWLMGSDTAGSNLIWRNASGNENRVYQSTIQKLEIGNNVTNIQNRALENCLSLTSVTVPSSVTTILDYAFQHCDSLQAFTFPDHLTSVNPYTFSACGALKFVSLPNIIVTIGRNAFANCQTLPSISIPHAVRTINTSTFSGCVALTSITMSEWLEQIGSLAFNGCNGLVYVKFTSTSPPTTATRAWTGISSDCVIYVPTGSLAAYTGAANCPSSSTYTYVEY